MTAGQHEPGKLNAAAAALIRATLTNDQWTAEVARVAGALLVEASGSKAQAAALVDEWVRESVKIRARKAA